MEITTSRLKNLINTKTPFAVMSYDDFLASDRDLCVKKHETIIIYKNDFHTQKMNELDIRFFKQNISLFTEKIRSEDGSIYEFMDFSDIAQFIEIKEARIELERIKKEKKEKERKLRSIIKSDKDNAPFLIRGIERKNLKKELSELKSCAKNFPYFHQLDKDMATVYGGSDEYPMSDEKAKERIEEIKDKIKTIELQLTLKETKTSEKIEETKVEIEPESENIISEL
jgi:hypothetical protein